MDANLNLSADISESANALLKEPAKSAGGMGSTIIDFLHNTLFYPLQKYNIKAQSNLDRYTKQLKQQSEMIPEEFRDEPNMNVWGQTMDNLRWNFDDEQKYIRDMFANLLISDIDARTKKRVLPAYVSLVSQLSEQDAMFLKELCAKSSSDSVTVFTLRWRKANGEYLRIPNQRMIILTNQGDRLTLASEVLDNLERLKILDLQRGEYLTKDRKTCEKILEEVKGNYPVPSGFEKVDFEQGKLDITEFGRGFLDICIKSGRNN